MQEDQYRRYRRILSIYPSPRGFGFAVLEERGLLVAWGVARFFAGSGIDFEVRFEAMLDKYNPALLVAEEIVASERRRNIRAKIEMALELARLRNIDRHTVLRSEMRAALGLLAHATNHQVAAAVSEIFPELQQHLPRQRRPWEGVDERTYLFHAAALATAAVR